VVAGIQVAQEDSAMVMNAVVERCAKRRPVTVMARLALQRALEPAAIRIKLI
jgi:hypothetical protein